MPVPGLPPLLGGLTITSPTLLLQDAFDALTGQDAPQWGIFQDGTSVVAADNVLGVEYRQDWTIADYPIEQGGFQSYDKVNTPFDVRVTYSCGGSTDHRTAFLQSIADIAGSIDLYDAVTPEQVYENVNVLHYDYNRTATNGLGLMTVRIYLQEIRQSAQAAFSNTQAASGSGTQDDGTVQTTPPTNQQSESALNSLFGG